MKKGLNILAIILASFISVTYVKAEETGEGQTTINTIKITTNESAYNWFKSNNTFYCLNGDNCSYNDTFNQLYTYYENNLKNEYPYYVIAINYGVGVRENNEIQLFYFKNNNMNFDYYGYPYIWFQRNTSNFIYFTSVNTGITHIEEYNDSVYDIFGGHITDNITYKIYTLYDSNFDIISERDYEIANFYNDNSNLVINIGDKFPKIKDLLNYSSWADYESNNNSNYTTVDLSKYHYVLLNLKDYSKKEPFSSNLQVKGMVGITPIYNYGTTAKDDVIGNKIEDRCNLSYKDYTDHRLYIIKSDLENKAIYAVKGCEDNSSFKFDNSVFDITYVTDDNIDDPIVTIDGKEYHTIPYNQLPSTATKNEEENYIPGESKELSFSEIVDNVTDTLSSVWSSIITFMNLFTKFFNTLPIEIRAISITTFTTACTLGIIKILKS